MKKLILILFLIPLCFNAQIKKDKYYHASAGIVIASGTYAIGQFSEREMNPAAPALMAFTAGCGKEFFDVMNGGYFSYEDVLWTTASGIAVNFVIRKIWKPRKKVTQKEEIFDYNPPLTEI